MKGDGKFAKTAQIEFRYKFNLIQIHCVINYIQTAAIQGAS
jgi:hypothetical protein